MTEVLNTMLRSKVIPTIRADSLDKATAMARALAEGEMEVIEITFTVPGADQAIARLRSDFPNLLVGAGTVLDAPTARQALLAGAQFLVTPIISQEVAEMANRYQVPSIIGALTPTEVARALELGADMVKLFPADAVGPAYIKAVHGPLPQARILATGGVRLDNLQSWFSAGAVAVGAASSLLGDVSKTQDYAALSVRAKQWVTAVRSLTPH